MGRMDFMEAMVESNVGFYIGDPCYVLDDEEYYKNWGDRNGFRDGEIQSDSGVWFVHDTAFGDGEYHDQYGTEYGVDSGTLAVIPMEVVYAHPREDIVFKGNGVVSIEKMMHLGNVVMKVGCELMAEVEYVYGIFSVRIIHTANKKTMIVEELEIDTYGHDEDEDDEELWEDDEDEEEDEE